MGAIFKKGVNSGILEGEKLLGIKNCLDQAKLFSCIFYHRENILIPLSENTYFRAFDPKRISENSLSLRLEMSD